MGRGVSMQPLSSGHTHLLKEQRVQNRLPGPHFLLAASYSCPSSIFTHSKPLSFQYCSYFRKYKACPEPSCCRPATPHSSFRSIFQNGCRGRGPSWSFWEADPELLTGVRPAPGQEGQEGHAATFAIRVAQALGGSVSTLYGNDFR